MMPFVLIGMSAGAAAALLFASIMSGTLLSVPLFYLTPLPIMIAGLGWSHWSALIGSVVAASALGAIFGGTFFFGFLTAAGLPAWWLSYLAMLARPAAAPEPDGNASAASTGLEWYPPGRLLLWAAMLGVTVALIALATLIVIPQATADAESFRVAMRAALATLMRPDLVVDGKPAVLPENTGNLIAVMALAIPPAAAVLATILNVINLWLAGRVVKFSGRLTRPWPALAELTLPPQFAALLIAALVLSFVDSLLGIAAGVLAAGLVLAYGLLGFAVLHSITQGITSRGFLLSGVYASVLVFQWPILALCVLGLIETVMHLRARAARRRGWARPGA
ncbi:MAG: hypothetical protein GC182_09660 [Rhodopseudomonas sp.]|nr:hypothetical protein [Rhodopseudomonas sp.]